jgi:predicted CoA-binding protein
VVAAELRTDEEIFALLASAKRIAVLGIKTEAQADQPAFYVPKYMLDAGYDIIPVPVYYPDVTEIMGKPVFRKVAEIPGAQRREPNSLSGVGEPHVATAPPIDIVNVFRKSSDVAAHVDDILAARPRAVWLQQGIRDDASAAVFIKAGIQVVQDACILVMHRRYRAGMQP